MIKTFVMISVFLFTTSMTAFGNETPELSQNTLKMALEYALCQVLYWHDGATNLSLDCSRPYNGLYENVGKTTLANLYCKKSDGITPKWICAEFAQFSSGRALTIDESVMGDEILFLDYDQNSCSKLADMKLMTKQIRVKVPADWKDRILSSRVKIVGPEKIKLQSALKNIFFGDQAKVEDHGIQHFFVGPFTKYDCNMYVYWAEKKECWSLPISPADFGSRGEQDYNLAAPYTLWKPMDAVLPADDPNIRCDSEVVNTVLINCVRDGDLIEVELP